MKIWIECGRLRFAIIQLRKWSDFIFYAFLQSTLSPWGHYRGVYKMIHFACGRDFHMHENLQIKHVVNISNPLQWLTNLRIKQKCFIRTFSSHRIYLSNLHHVLFVTFHVNGYFSCNQNVLSRNLMIRIQGINPMFADRFLFGMRLFRLAVDFLFSVVGFGFGLSV